jgi:hypothetical protein
MALIKSYLVATNRVDKLFNQIRDGQAPDQFTQQILKDWGFKSTNDRQFIPLLKALNFLSPDGKPTTIYHDYRDHSKSKQVMAQAIRKAYEDIFLIKETPTNSDIEAIRGKFKSYHNADDNLANLMTKTFFELLKLSDLTTEKIKKKEPKEKHEDDFKKKKTPTDPKEQKVPTINSSGLHYNIQIHLPPTKDIEVYNAIFKSLKEHLFEE